MRIYAFTAGAARMYCGSCLRDNALAAELRRQGHKVLLLPVYTPTLVDEENASSRHVVFGGISVYLQQHSSFFRKTPNFVDRLWDSWLALKAASFRSIAVNPRLLGEMTVAMLEGEAGPQKKEFAKMLDYLRGLEPPEVVTLPNSLLIAMAAPIRRALGCPVYVTLQGEDLFIEGLEEPYRLRVLELLRRRAGEADGFIAVSQFYARAMSAYLGVGEQRMHVVPLGVNTTDLDRAPNRRDGPFCIGYLARVAPEKSLHLLAEAYRWMRQEGGLPPSRLEAAGYLAPEYRGYLDGIRRRLAQWGLEREFRYHGALNRQEKIRFLQSLDVLSVPSAYAEPKGLYALEAMACGVPVIEPRHGAFPEMLERTRGGLLAEPGDPVDFGRQILRLYEDPGLRTRMGEQAYRGVREFYSLAQMAQRAIHAYAQGIAAAAKS